MQQLNKLTSKQATVVAQLHEPPRDEPTLRAERNLMVNFTTTQAHAKGVAPSANREGGGQTEAAVAKASNASPPPTADNW
jgi:hypothetical protein